MKKLLLPIFGGILVIGNSILVTGQNIDTAVKVESVKETKNQELINSLHRISNHNNFSNAEIKAFQVTTQNWDNQLIDNVLNQALRFENNQLTIDYQQLNSSKLPTKLNQNLDLALANLNNAVLFGLIKVAVSQGTMELIYQTYTKNANSEIVNFDSFSLNGKLEASTFSSYMWYTAYGPSRWWKFWQWGGYIHFNETAVKNAESVNLVTKIINVFFLIKNIREISKYVNKLKVAYWEGNTKNINEAVKGLSKSLGGVILEQIGNIPMILDIFIAVVAFIIGLTATPTVGQIILGVSALVSSILASVTRRMIAVNQGNGVKWQWHSFVIPGEIYVE
ncbi:MAG: hypothetical protein ACRC8P_00310 [Spiroplasma sp.]